MILSDIADYLREWWVDDHRVFCRASNANMFDIDLAYLAFWPLGYVACPKIHCKWMNVNFSEHGMMLQASAVSPVDPGPFGGVACWQGEKMQKDLKGFEFHYDSRCSTLWICWRCLNVVLICSDQALFYVVSPRRCNHPVVQRNNQQGPRLLWNRCYIFCDTICFVGSIWRFFPTCFSICFCHSDWLIVLACLCRCCRCGRWISSCKSNRAGSWCSLWGFRWCGLFAFVHICQHWNNWLHSEVAVTWYRSPCWHGCCHIMAPYSDCFWQRHTYHQAVPCSSQWNLRLVFQFCLLCLFLRLMNVVVSSTDLQCILFQCFGMCGYCDIADYLHEWCVDDHRVFCRASNANMFDIDLAYLAFWPLGCVACPKIQCKRMNVNFSEHGMMLQASAVSPVDPGPFGGVACWQGEKMQKDLKGFEFHYDSRCSTLWICWRCLNVVLICSDQALFYVVSPRRCNHPVVQRNNQQGPRLLLEWLLQPLWCRLFRWQYLARMVATIFVMPFVSLAVFGAFFQLIYLFVSVILTDWLCLLVCVDAVDAVDGCQVTKAIEQAAGAVSGAFGGVACSHLFTFVYMSTLKKLVAFWSCGHLISKSLLTWMLPYHGAIFGLLLTKAHLSPSGTMQQSMKSQACFSVLFVLYVFTSDECCCFKHNSMSE